jgi:hypothetical protein
VGCDVGGGECFGHGCGYCFEFSISREKGAIVILVVRLCSVIMSEVGEQR